MKIIGVSQKGKNRVREHGDEWTAVATDADNTKMLLEAEDGYLKWMFAQNDPDFKRDLNG